MFLRNAPKTVEEKGRYEMLTSIHTDSGCIREVNEDCGRFTKPTDVAVQARKGSLAIVADGMGGHSAGEVASKMAVEIISQVYYDVEQSPEEALRTAFEEANRQIYAASMTDENLKGMGTTGTALALYGTSAVMAHVGDSRLYLLRGDQIYLMTEDHSAVMEMVKLGIINRKQARNHEDKNVIIRALGTAPQVEVSTWANPFAILNGDQFILCSDGLYDLVEDAEIKEAVLAAPDTHTACETLIELAKKRGGPDNITVGIVSIKPAGYMEARNLRETREFEVAL